jgi:hypothetical protein
VRVSTAPLVYARRASIAAAVLLLAGCAIFEQRPAAQWVSVKDGLQADVAAPKTPAARGYRSSARPSIVAVERPNEPGNCGSVDQCTLLLRLMVGDPDRRWINERPSSAVYANGTRLFAYRALRRALRCSELSLAVQETNEAEAFLTRSIPGLKPEQIVRVRALNAEVRGELEAEFDVRCGGSQATETQ